MVQYLMIEHRVQIAIVLSAKRGINGNKSASLVAESATENGTAGALKSVLQLLAELRFSFQNVCSSMILLCIWCSL